jgi:hypothetical protein
VAALSNHRTGHLNGTTSGWAARCLFSVAPNLYLVALDRATPKVRVYKGTGDGTWTEQDSADAPAHTGADASYDAWLHTNGFIYVAYRTATNTVRVRRFDTATDQWETTDIGAANATTAADATFALSVGVRSDGDVLLIYRDTGTSDIFWTRYEGVSWAAGAAVLAGTYAPLYLLPTDNSDTMHVFGYDTAANDLTQRGISNANALLTEGDIDATGLLTFSQFAGYVNDAGVHRIAVLSRDSTGELDFVHATSTGAPIWTTVGSVSPTSVTDPGPMGGAVAAFNNRFTAVWSGDARGEIHMDVSDDFPNPVFGADTTLVSGLSATDPAVYAIGTATGVPVVYTNMAATPSVDIVWAQGNPDDTGIQVERVQLKQTTSANAVSTFSSLTTNANGNLLIAYISGKVGTTQSISTLTDDGGNTWTFRRHGVISGSNSRIEEWYCLNAAPITSMTVTYTGTVLACSLALYEISGHDTSSPFVGDSTNGDNDSTSDTTYNAGSPQASTGPALLIGSITSAAQGNMTSWRASAGWAENWQTGSTTIQAHATAYRRVADTSAYPLAFVGSSASTNGYVWAAIKQASAGGTTTVTPGTATATAAANAPTVKITMLPGTATATGQANAPTVQARATPGTATATGSANAPTVKVTVTPGTATATGQANEPAVQIRVTPGTATATGDANPPVNVGENLTRVTPGTATATGAANTPTVTIRVTPGTATATGQANAPTVAVTLKPGTATASGAANVPVVKVTVTPSTATATGDANSPTVRIVLKPGTATATASAGEPLVVTPSAPSNVLKGRTFFSLALGGSALRPVPVVLIPGASVISSALGGGSAIVPPTGGASYTSPSLAGGSFVEST